MGGAGTWEERGGRSRGGKEGEGGKQKNMGDNFRMLHDTFSKLVIPALIIVIFLCATQIMVS